MAEYSPKTWLNNPPLTTTPITAEELNRIETGIATRGNIRRLLKTSTGWPTRPTTTDYVHWVGPIPAPTGFINGDTWAEIDPSYPISGTIEYNFDNGLFTPTATTSPVNGGTISTTALTSATLTSGLGYPSANVLQMTTATTNQTTTTRYLEIALMFDGSWRIDSLSFTGARGGASTPRGMVVRSSADGYGTPLPGSGEFTTTRPTWATYNIDTSSIIAARIGTLRFRFYPFAPATSTSVEIDNIVFNVTALTAA